MRRISAFAVAPTVVMVAVWAAATAHGEASDDVRLLPWRRAVDVGALAPGDWAEAWDDSVLAAATRSDFADVRVTDAAGVAQAFTRRDAALADIVYTPLEHREVVADERTTLQLDLGRSAPAQLAVRIRAGRSGSRFVVEASDDSVRWHDVAFPGTGPRPEPGVEIVDIGRVSERWVRVALPAERPPDAVLKLRPGVQAPRVPPPGFPPSDPPIAFLLRHERRTPREPVPFRVVHTRFEGRAWVAEIATDAPPLALCRIVLTPRSAFARHAVEVEAQLANGVWRLTGRAGIEILPDSWLVPRSQGIEWDPVRTSALRLRVDGADAPNAPVTVDSVMRTPVRFAFPKPDGARWLTLGDAHVTTAHASLDPEQIGALRFVHVRLGDLEPNPAFRPPGLGLAWLQRRPAALAAALLAILALVALIVLRTPPAPR